MRKIVLGLVVAALGVSSCGGGNGEALVVYSGRTENLVGPLLDRFSVETGIEIEVRYGQSADLALLIQQEGDRSPADVFISQSPGAVGLLAGEGMLGALSNETLALVADEYRNESGRWIGLTGRLRVLVYNSDLVAESELPSTLFDLAADRYREKIGVAPANGSFQDFVTGMRELYGDEATRTWLSALEDNGAVAYANNTAIVRAVGRGEIEMGLVNHYYNLRALAEDATLPSRNHHFDDVGSLLIITAAGVLDGSSRRSQAEALIRYLLGDEAQTFFTDETFEYPLANGASATEQLADLSDVGATTYDFNDLGGGLARTKELIDESGLEAP